MRSSVILQTCTKLNQNIATGSAYTVHCPVCSVHNFLWIRRPCAITLECELECVISERMHNTRLIYLQSLNRIGHFRALLVFSCWTDDITKINYWEVAEIISRSPCSKLSPSGDDDDHVIRISRTLSCLVLHNFIIIVNIFPHSNNSEDFHNNHNNKFPFLSANINSTLPYQTYDDA